MDLQKTYDVVVLGGGPAGCAAALALQQQGIDHILVVEPSNYQNIRIGESLPPDTRQLFAQLGILPEFLQENHEACLGSCACWGSDVLGYNDFLFNPYGHGWHLDRNRFDAFLARKVREREITVMTGWQFCDCAQVDLGFQVALLARDSEIPSTTSSRISSGRSPTPPKEYSRQVVETRFVIDATGRGAYFARRQGAKRLLHDRLICAIAFFDLPNPDAFSQLTMLEAVEYGWWYAAKLPNHRLVVAVASEPELIKHRGLEACDRWQTHLQATQYIGPAVTQQVGWQQPDQAATRSRHGLSSKPIVCAAPSFQLDRVENVAESFTENVPERKGWLAVGDSASAYDPISSQGIYKALSDGIAAAQVVAANWRGETALLGEYQKLVENRFQDYLKNRNYFYDLEQRWPTAPFWQMRRARRTLRN